MKEFNLERALAGDPVITRDGRKVLHIAYFPDAINESKIYAFINGNRSPSSFYINGRYFYHDESDNDLFMTPKSQTYYVNVYKCPDGVMRASSNVSTIKLDKNNLPENGNPLIAILEFTVEE